MVVVTTDERRIWIDGELVAWEQATVHVLSQSLQRGTLVFDYVSVHETPRGPAAFRLEPHLERFATSCELAGLPLEHDVDELRRAALATAAANPGCTSIKISAYIASIEVELVPQNTHVSVAIAAYDIRRDIIDRNPGKLERRPEVRLWIEKVKRNRRDDILEPQAKVASNYGPTLRAKWEARRNGYDEILLLSHDGSLAETPTCNLFLIDSAGTLRTPSAERVLHGVTRDSILELASAEGLTVSEDVLFPDDLEQAAEVFLTATTAGVWPVGTIDRRPVGDGRPGPTTLRLRDRFRAVSRGQDPAYEHWLDPLPAATGPPNPSADDAVG